MLQCKCVLHVIDSRFLGAKELFVVGTDRTRTTLRLWWLPIPMVYGGHTMQLIYMLKGKMVTV